MRKSSTYCAGRAMRSAKAFPSLQVPILKDSQARSLICIAYKSSRLSAQAAFPFSSKRRAYMENHQRKKQIRIERFAKAIRTCWHLNWEKCLHQTARFLMKRPFTGLWIFQLSKG